MKPLIIGILVAVASGHLAEASVIIDPFSTTQNTSVSGMGGNPKSFANSSANNAVLALGQQREFVIRRSAGNGTVDLDVNGYQPGAITFSAPTNTGARALLTWDGPGTTTAVNSFAPASGQIGIPDTFALNYGFGHDLTQRGWNDRVRVNGWADNPVTLWFTFYQSASVYTRGSLVLPIGSTVYDPVLDFDVPAFTNSDLLFSNFVAFGGTTQNILKATKAITLQIDALSSQDVVLDFFATTNAAGTEPVPEPGTMLTLGAAVTVLAACKFRRNIS